MTIARAVSGSYQETTTNFTTCDFVLTCRTGNGLVVEDIAASVWGDTGTALSVFPNIGDGEWLLEKRAAPDFPGITLQPKMDAGIMGSQSEFRAGTSAETTFLLNPVVLGSEKTNAGGGLGVVYSFRIQPGLTWFIGPNTSLRFFPNSRPTGGTLRADLSLTWREHQVG